MLKLVLTIVLIYFCTQSFAVTCTFFERTSRESCSSVTNMDTCFSSYQFKILTNSTVSVQPKQCLWFVTPYGGDGNCRAAVDTCIPECDQGGRSFISSPCTTLTNSSICNKKFSKNHADATPNNYVWQTCIWKNGQCEYNTDNTCTIYST